MKRRLISILAGIALAATLTVPVLAAKPPPAFTCNATVSATQNGVPQPGAFTVSVQSDTNRNGQTEVIYSSGGYVLSASYSGCV